MFKYFSAIFFISYMQISFAQTYSYYSIFDTFTVWKTSNSAPKNVSWSNSLWFENETEIISNKKYRILNRSTSYSGVDRTTQYFIRKDSTQKIFLNKDGVEYLLYDFNALAEDTIWQTGSVLNAENIYYYVSKIDSVEIDGSLRKQFSIKSNWISPSGKTEWKWIEGIGDTKFGILGFMAPDIGYAYKLCVILEESVFSEEGNFCSFDNNTDLNKIKFVPNPATNSVSLYSIEKMEFKLYDVFGRLRLIKPLGERQLNISSLEKGIYYTILHISSNQKIKRKFVKL